MYDLPTQIEIGGKAFNIRNNGDYRVILDAIAAFQDPEISEEERIISSMIIFYADLSTEQDIYDTFDNPETAIREMMSFISLNDDETGYNAGIKLIDWVQDEKLVVSAINNVARTEIRAVPYLHWWTFIGYYMAIGECSLSMIVGIRYKLARHKKLEKYELEFKNKNPQYFTWKKDQKEAELLMKQIWEDKKEGLDGGI